MIGSALHVAAAVVGAAVTALGLAGVCGHAWSVRVAGVIPLGGLELAMDPLAGVFVALVGGAAVPASVYAIGYREGERRGALAFIALIAAMAAVPLAANVMTFLIAWELMSLASYVLVLAPGGGHGGHAEESVWAAWVYAVMAHAGVACLLGGFVALGVATGSLRFADWSAQGSALPATSRHAAFLLLTLGFASKAGIMPLHVWLPRAHPAAPSHVSALMSGAMIKLGLYGLARAAFDWLAPLPAGWGAALLIAGAVSALAGILSAIVERDLKRMLAFSSIENVGVILTALGAALVFRASGFPALAVLAFAAALYHALNHAAFKSLLFLAAGAVVARAGTRNMDDLGGLIHRMPWTAGAFLLGALAIAALPPLNGFVSEWLIVQSLLESVEVPRPGLNLVFAIGLASLALTAGLTVAAFVKAMGATFLALPRSESAAQATEAPATMRAGMAMLGALCVALGLAPTLVLPRLLAVGARLMDAAPVAAGADRLTIAVAGDFARLSMPIVALALGVALLVPVLALARLGITRGRRWYETWGCGRIVQTARMEYTATALAQPFRRVFDFVYRPVPAIELDGPAGPRARYFVRTIRYRAEPRPLLGDEIHIAVGRTLRDVTERIRLMQSGHPNAYLAYILVALVVLLVLA